MQKELLTVLAWLNVALLFCFLVPLVGSLTGQAIVVMGERLVLAPTFVTVLAGLLILVLTPLSIRHFLGQDK